MITNFFIRFFVGLVQLIMDLLPSDINWPTDTHTAIAYFGGYLNQWEYILPVSTVKTIIGSMVLILITVLLTIMSSKLVGFIRGTSNPI